MGSPVLLIEIFDQFQVKKTVLGNDFMQVAKGK